MVTKQIITSLKSHVDLFHLGITLNEKASELLVNNLFMKSKTEKSLNCLNLRDSKFSDKGFNALMQILGTPKLNTPELYHITGYSFYINSVII